MSTTHESEGFVSTPLEGQGARRKDNYYLESEENEVRFREDDNEYKRLKEDFARIARNRRTRNHSRSDLSKSPSPRRRQPLRRSTNLPKFKILCKHCSKDVNGSSQSYVLSTKCCTLWGRYNVKQYSYLGRNSPRRRQPLRRSTNLPKFKILCKHCSKDVNGSSQSYVLSTKCCTLWGRYNVKQYSYLGRNSVSSHLRP